MTSLTDNLSSSATKIKIGIISGIAVIVVFTAFAVYWVVHQQYAVLFKDLEGVDAANVVSELEKQKIPYKLDNGGSTILVKEGDVHSARLKLMESEAKIRGGLGFELFDKSDFGMTEFVQKINYQRALQGELARTINSLKEVKFARVHLVMPESSLFKRQDEPATASVTLFLKDGESLSQKRIIGIQKLVSSSVPGLQQSNVTIVNQNGETISNASKEPDDLLSISDRLQRKKEVETHLMDKVNRVLEKAFGPRQALVSIDATINFDQVKTTKETVLEGGDGAGSVVKKREVSSDGKEKNLTKETEYRLGSRVDQIVFAPGDIKKLSVGVLVPSDTSEERIYKIQDLVAMAVGLNERRGDEIVVHAVKTFADVIPSRQTSAAPVEHNHNREGGLKLAAPTTADQSLPTKDAVSGEFVQSNKENNAPVTGERVAAEPEYDAQWLVTLEEFISGQSERDLWIFAAIFVAGVFLVFALVRFRSKKGLSSEEREKVLNQLKEWLDRDSTSIAQELKA